MDDIQDDNLKEDTWDEPKADAAPVEAAPAVDEVTAAAEASPPADVSLSDGGAEAKVAPVFPSYSGGLNPNKLRVIVKALKACEQNINNVVRLMEKELGAGLAETMTTSFGAERSYVPAAAMGDLNQTKEMEINGVKAADGRVVEGVFDGQNMVGSDGKIYSVPPNYASKSKLVEGDMLKLTITPAGSFIYKQIGPTDRSRIVASLGFDPTVGEYYATHDTRRWNILKASVTYFKGEPDDEIVVLVPKNGPSKWAAVENIIKRLPII
jgi:hypothetical protein